MPFLDFAAGAGAGLQTFGKHMAYEQQNRREEAAQKAKDELTRWVQDQANYRESLQQAGALERTQAEITGREYTDQAKTKAGYEHDAEVEAKKAAALVRENEAFDADLAKSNLSPEEKERVSLIKKYKLPEGAFAKPDKTVQDDPTFPAEVKSWLATIPQWAGNNPDIPAATRARQALTEALPRLQQAHPKLDVHKAEQYIDAMFGARPSYESAAPPPAIHPPSAGDPARDPQTMSPIPFTGEIQGAPGAAPPPPPAASPGGVSMGGLGYRSAPAPRPPAAPPAAIPPAAAPTTPAAKPPTSPTAPPPAAKPAAKAPARIMTQADLHAAMQAKGWSYEQAKAEAEARGYIVEDPGDPLKYPMEGPGPRPAPSAMPTPPPAPSPGARRRRPNMSY